MRTIYTAEEIATRRAFNADLKAYLKKRKESKNEALHTERQSIRDRERVEETSEKG